MHQFNLLSPSRMYLLEAMPSSLPKLLNAVKWNQHKDIALVCCCLLLNETEGGGMVGKGG